MLKYVKIIDDTTKLCQVGIGTNTQAYKAMGFEQQEVEHGYDGNYYLLGYAPMKPLEQLKTEKWQEIKQMRDKKEQEGVPYLDKVLDSDSLSVQRITIAVQTAQLAITTGQEFTIDWTCKDNSTLAMTAQQVIGIPMALANQSNSLHQKARLLREQIDNATTVEQIEQIVWE